jgi:hypothetical protein
MLRVISRATESQELNLRQNAEPQERDDMAGASFPLEKWKKFEPGPVALGIPACQILPIGFSLPFLEGLMIMSISPP